MLDDMILAGGIYYTVMDNNPIEISPSISEEVKTQEVCSVYRNMLKPPNVNRKRLLQTLSEKTFSRVEQEEVLWNLLEYMFEPLMKEKAENMAKAHARRIGESEAEEKETYIAQIYN